MNTTTQNKKIPIGHATLLACSQWLDKDRGTIRKIITDAGLTPRKIGRYEYYRVADIVTAMIEGEGLDLQQERAKLAVQQEER